MFYLFQLMLTDHISSNIGLKDMLQFAKLHVDTLEETVILRSPSC